MALPSFCREAVKVSRAPLIDQRGTKARDWANAEEHGLAGCSVQFGSTSTDRGEPREAVSSAATLYAPPGADVEAGDRVSCALGEFWIEGRPMPRVSPTGATSHVECPLSRWEG